MSIIETPKPKMTPEEVIRQLRELRLQITDFAQLERFDRVSLAPVANVDPEFVLRSIGAIGASATLEGAVGHSPESLRQEDDYTRRVVSVSDELRTFLDGVDTAITVRRHRIGLIALQAYNIGRQLVRREEHADLLPHIAAMRNHNKFGKRGKRKKEEEKVKPGEPQAKPGETPAAPATQSKPQ
jgi:hypothetical protein